MCARVVVVKVTGEVVNVTGKVEVHISAQESKMSAGETNSLKVENDVHFKLLVA